MVSLWTFFAIGLISTLNLASGQKFDTCYVTGDPHYWTFDDLAFDYQGVCKHLLVKPLIPSDRQYFEIYIRNEYRYNSFSVAYVKYLEIYYNNTMVRVSRNAQTNPITTEVWVQFGTPHVAMQTGVPQTGPFTVNGISVSYQLNGFVRLQIPNQVIAEYDGEHFVQVTIPSTYMKQVTGMCGNYDLNAANDATTGAEYVAQSDPEAGQEKECIRKEVYPIDSCDPTVKPFYTASCSHLNNTQGILKDCLAYVDRRVANHFTRNCLYDSCALLKYTSVCAYVDALTKLCPRVNVKNWRQALGCDCGH